MAGSMRGMEILILGLIGLLPLFFLIWIALQIREANATLRDIALSLREHDE